MSEKYPEIRRIIPFSHHMNTSVILIAGLVLLAFAVILSLANFLMSLVGPLVIPALAIIGVWFVIRLIQGTQPKKLGGEVREAGGKVLQSTGQVAEKVVRVSRAAVTAASEELKK